MLRSRGGSRRGEEELNIFKDHLKNDEKEVFWPDS